MYEHYFYCNISFRCIIIQDTKAIQKTLEQEAHYGEIQTSCHRIPKLLSANTLPGTASVR